MTVLITGATGFLGGVVVTRLDDPLALVRGPNAADRLPGVRVLEGDLTNELPELPEEITAIIHCAASVSFSLPLEEAREINVEGTRRLLTAAQRLPNLERFVHVSTAYVAGTRRGPFFEADHDLGQSFRNTYERSKWEAEALVRASGLPWAIVRPSIVVGDSRTGETSSFNVLYYPLQAFARGLVTSVPADPDGIVDVVPVDHVADVIEAALNGAGPVLHAVAGENAITASELANLASDAFGRPRVRFSDDEDGPEGLDVYFPYFKVKSRFRADNVREQGLAPPPLEEYFPRLVEYAELTRWGRRPVSAEQPGPAR
jgi:long-chain acyl-CoA synthetase